MDNPFRGEFSISSEAFQAVLDNVMTHGKVDKVANDHGKKGNPTSPQRPRVNGCSHPEAKRRWCLGLVWAFLARR